jgi:hypothetical protein
MSSRRHFSESTLALIEWAILAAIGGGLLLILF